MYEREEKCIHCFFLVESLEERNYWEDLGVVRRIFLKWIIKKWDGTDWIRLVLGKDR